jgi:hypothetical protein
MTLANNFTIKLPALSTTNGVGASCLIRTAGTATTIWMQVKQSNLRWKWWEHNYSGPAAVAIIIQLKGVVVKRRRQTIISHNSPCNSSVAPCSRVKSSLSEFRLTPSSLARRRTPVFYSCHSHTSFVCDSIWAKCRTIHRCSSHFISLVIQLNHLPMSDSTPASFVRRRK